MISKGSVPAESPEGMLAWTWVAEDYIARHAGVSLLTATGALSRLKERGFIDVTPRPRDDYGKQQSTYKRINRKWLAKMLAALPGDHANWVANRYKKKTKTDGNEGNVTPSLGGEYTKVSLNNEPHVMHERTSVIKTTHDGEYVAQTKQDANVQLKPVLATKPINTTTLVAITKPAAPLGDAMKLAEHFETLRGNPAPDLECAAQQIAPVLALADLATAKAVLDYLKADEDPFWWKKMVNAGAPYFTRKFAALHLVYLNAKPNTKPKATNAVSDEEQSYCDGKRLLDRGSYLIRTALKAPVADAATAMVTANLAVAKAHEHAAKIVLDYPSIRTRFALEAAEKLLERATAAQAEIAAKTA